MLRVLNKLCHGYVFVPVTLSLRSKGFFELLTDGQFTRVKLILFNQIAFFCQTLVNTMRNIKSVQS